MSLRRQAALLSKLGTQRGLSVVAWGQNQLQQGGTGSTEAVLQQPTPVQDLGNCQSPTLLAGRESSAALSADGQARH